MLWRPFWQKIMPSPTTKKILRYDYGVKNLTNIKTY